MSMPRFSRAGSALVLGGALLGGLIGVPVATRADSGDPPVILFAGELASAPSYDHIVVIYSKRLDETVALDPGTFSLSIDGVTHTPTTATYLLAGLGGPNAIFDPSGSTFIRLGLPPGVTVGVDSVLQLAYAPGAEPIRDLSLTPARAETVEAAVFDPEEFALLGALVDAAHGADRVTLVFIGQVDIDLLPDASRFSVTVNGAPATVTELQPVHPDLGLGLLDLVLAGEVDHDDVLAVSYAPGGNPLAPRNGGLPIEAFTDLDATLFIPPTSESSVAIAGQTVTTSTGNAPDAFDVLATSVTTPNPGPVSIEEAPTGPSPAGYSFFGEAVQITAPAATDPAAPLVFRFEMDATLIPPGEDERTVAILRDGVALGPCTGPAGHAVPSPCMSARELLPDGDIRITVRTLAASTWNFAVVDPYEFGGFVSPVDGLGVLNVATAGSAIPVRFSLGGDRGPGIFTAGAPASRRVACDTEAPLDPIEETATRGGSVLAYDEGSDRYRYIWSTDRSWKGTCRSLLLSFGDGSSQTALFKFR